MSKNNPNCLPSDSKQHLMENLNKKWLPWPHKSSSLCAENLDRIFSFAPPRNAAARSLAHISPLQYFAIYAIYLSPSCSLKFSAFLCWLVGREFIDRPCIYTYMIGIEPPVFAQVWYSGIVAGEHYLSSSPQWTFDTQCRCSWF